MSNEMNNTVEEVQETAVTEEVTESAVEVKTSKKAKKPEAKKDNFFKRTWKKFVKLCKDTYGEMKKVVWTSKTELSKSTKLVIVAVLAISIVIAVIDLSCSFVINKLAGLIG